MRKLISPRNQSLKKKSQISKYLANIFKQIVKKTQKQHIRNENVNIFISFFKNVYNNKEMGNFLGKYKCTKLNHEEIEYLNWSKQREKSQNINIYYLLNYTGKMWVL